MKSNPVSVLIYNAGWIAFCFCGDETLRHEAAGSSSEIPEEILGFLRDSEVQRVRILLSGEVHRLETSMPSKLTFDEVNTLLANEIAELSATDHSGLLCAGTGGEAFGVCGRCMFTGCFERTQVDRFFRQITSGGFVFDGIGLLELACLARWNTISDLERETLVLFGEESSFVFPARNIPGNPGPMSVSGGIRHALRDFETWALRFQRSCRFLEKAGFVSALLLGGSPDKMRSLLQGAAGLPELTFPDAAALLENVARMAAGVRVNSRKASVPMVNPHVPRKRFHHAYIAAPCLLILLAPLVCSLATDTRFKHQMKSIQKKTAHYLPLEKEIKAATRKKKRTQKKVETLTASQRFLADRRKPLFAFIHMAYFFSKYAGDTVRIESIADTGGEIQVKGIYIDPEDGQHLNKELEAFVEEQGFRVIHNKMSEQENGEGFVVLCLDLRVDYTRLRK